MFIGLFTSASAQTIPTGTDLVQSSGYGTAGVGAAEYVYDAAVDATYVTNNPRTAFVSANGRGFKLNPETMPPATAFGAVVTVGAPSAAIQTANSAAIQAAMYWGAFSLPGLIWCDPTIKLYPWALGASGTSRIEGTGAFTSGLMFNCPDTITHACITIPEGYVGSDNKLYDANGNLIPANPSGPPTGRSIDWSNWSVNTKYGKYATAVYLTNISNSIFRQVNFTSAYRGLFIATGFNVTVDTCYFPGAYFNAGRTLAQVESGWRDSFGLYSDNHTIARNIAGTGWGTTVWINGSGNMIDGARLEVAEHALRLGGGAYKWDLWNGTDFGGGSTFSGVVQGVTTESNRVGINVSLANNALLSECAVTGSAGAVPLGRAPLAGVVISNSVISTFMVRSVVCSVLGTLWGRLVNAGCPVFEDMVGMQTQGSSAVFSRNGRRFSVRNFQQNPTVTNALSEDRSSMTLDSQAMTLGLTGINLRDAPVFAKNLGGSGTCSASSTSATVTFPILRGNGTAQYNAAPAAVTDAGSTLAPGNYAYATTLLGKRGETGVNWSPFATFVGDLAYKSVTVASGQRVDMSVFAPSNPNVYRRRIYKYDLDAGYFLGFWELPATTTTFTDNGSVAFTGKDVPPPSDGIIPSQAEIDTNYELVVLPSWNTTAYAAATDKLTTGFTVHFGTAPSADATFSWLLLRA